MPVLFEEIRKDLGLSLVQIGTIWGMTNIAGIFVSLIAGYLGDRFGVRLVLGISCLLVGLTGALRGFADSFFILAVTVFFNGLVKAMIPINITKLTAIWFREKNLGLANAVGSMGMGFGMMLGPMISATVISPWLGGWRNVLFFYGILSAAVGGLWFYFGRTPKSIGLPTDIIQIPFKKIFPTLVRNKVVWLVGLTMTFRMAGIQGMTGYLPLFLTNKGWTSAHADGALALFYALSTAFVIPLAALSDRIGRRKVILLTAVVVTTLSLGLLPVVGAGMVWALIVVSGLFMDAFMSILMTTLLESKGISAANAGTALGIVFTIGPIGSVFAPPLGNSLAPINPGLPFLFWAGLSVIALISLIMINETGRNKRKATGKNYQQPSTVS
jgi:MFS transporter, NNP family, nitrate/nitrite transporter